MPNVKYTDSATFRCLENLKEGSLDISLIQYGQRTLPARTYLFHAKR